MFFLAYLLDVLNRFPYRQPSDATESPGPQLSTLHVMMYMFPRQFGLHNVFTSEVDSKETVQPFKDYTLREDEIHAKFSIENGVKIPKRLRGKAAELVKKLQVQHNRCPYKALLDHHCIVSSLCIAIQNPLTQQATYENASRLVRNVELQQTNTYTLTAFQTQKLVSTNSIITLASSKPSMLLPRKPSLMDRATPTAMVSAFCRAVLCKLVPHEFWGMGDVQKHNERVFLRNIDRFIQLRRFETLSLYEVSQDVKVCSIWELCLQGMKHLPYTRSQI